jgi:hypothetical protein
VDAVGRDRVASAAGVSGKTVSEWLRGKGPLHPGPTKLGICEGLRGQAAAILALANETGVGASGATLDEIKGLLQRLVDATEERRDLQRGTGTNRP